MSRMAIVTTVLLLFSFIVLETVGCPEDSVLGDDGECKCVSCPKHDCQTGQQPVAVREAIPEKPGSCCPLYECRSPVTLTYIPEDIVHQCVDESGRPHENGEHWQENDPCTNCTCERGVRECHTAMCRSCDRPLPRLPGECCPRCSEISQPCVTPFPCDLKCEHGFDFDESGCPVCRCRNQPEEKKLCPKLECGLNCEHGLLVDDSNCSICQCRNTRCLFNLTCQNNCPQGYKINEYGCPTCWCRDTCLDERNVSHPEGSSWNNDPCRSCTCELGGHISCNKTICSVACSDPLPPPSGLCCPLCPNMLEESRGWGIVPVVLIAVLALLCGMLTVHLVRNRFRARLVPSEADFTGFSQQYYKCVPVYETHVPVLRHAEKIAPL